MTSRAPPSDVTLMRVAQTSGIARQAVDVVCRHAGDEFAVVVNGAGLEAGYEGAVAEEPERKHSCAWTSTPGPKALSILAGYIVFPAELNLGQHISKKCEAFRNASIRFFHTCAPAVPTTALSQQARAFRPLPFRRRHVVVCVARHIQRGRTPPPIHASACA